MKFLLLTVLTLALGSQINGLPKKFPSFGNHVNGQLPNGGKIWVVLVAGSDTYDNYRHQADICHAYQISHEHGIPDEQIVVFMMDDIAYDPQNPRQGELINRPGGPDVYKGVPKDYTGKDGVLPDNMLAVLRGDKEAVKNIGSGKVVESGPDDHIFIYFADHGSTGFICFPDFENNLYSDVLNKAIQDLHDNKKFAKLVFYLEACESGSMFDNILPKDINVYAVTAAGDDESSWAFYCDDKEIGSCLGDEFSISWMEDSDNNTISTELLSTQFTNVKNRVKGSTPHEFGDLSIAEKFHAGDFQGNGASRSNRAKKTMPVNGKKINSRDVPLELLKMRVEKAKRENNPKYSVLSSKLRLMEQKRSVLVATTKNIVSALTKSDTETHEMLTIRTKHSDKMECYKNSVEYYIRKCFPKSTYYLGQMYVLANLCNSGFDHEAIKGAMDSSCRFPISNVH